MEQFNNSSELVILVDEQNNAIGTAPKATVHNKNTPLHRAFSVFLFDKNGALLLQQRALLKVTWPGVWSNSCCGHVSPGETTLAAAQRRLNEELGLKNIALFEVLPNYRYCFEKDGIVENEFCPVFAGFTSKKPRPNPAEVESIKWLGWQNFISDIKNQPGAYSPWCEEEALLLAENKEFGKLYKQHTK